MKLKNKTVLVTGAGGFIGSHLTERLVSLGANTKAFVRYNSRNDWGLLEHLQKDILSQVTIISGDLRDLDAVSKAVSDTDVVFHLGALIAIPYSYVHPVEVAETNVMGTVNILSAGREHNVDKIIHTSTSETYGTAKYVPIDENHPLQGQSPYSASKIGADKIAESFFKSFNTPIAIIRPFNTYGPRQSSRAIIPTIITQALYNKIVQIGNTNPTRDFTYVDDTVEGYIKIAESSESVGEVINIGSNFEISIGDLAKRILIITKSDAKLKADKKRIRPKASEVDRLLADNTKARKLIGWAPKISLDKGLKRTIEWISKNMDLYKVDEYVV